MKGIPKRQGKLTFLEDLGRCFDPYGQRSGKRHFIRVACDCGTTKCVDFSDYVHGKTSSCGCWHTRSGGLAIIGSNNERHPLYRAWNNMLQRAGKHKNYLTISVCEDWKSFPDFKGWALSNGWSDGLTLDRIDYTGGYCPSNCRWITQREQTRNTSRNVMIKIGDKTMCLQDWLDIFGITRNSYYCHKRRRSNPMEALKAAVLRHRHKNGREDLLKARHYIDLLLQYEYPNV